MNWINIVLSAVASALGVYYIVKNLSGEKFSKKRSLLFITLLTIFLSIITILSTGVTKLVLCLLIIIFSCCFILFNNKLDKAVYYGLIYTFLTYILELILSLILSVIFKYSLDKYTNFEYSMLIFSLIITIIEYLISRIKIVQEKVKKLETKILDNHIMKIYIAVFTMVIVLLVVNNYISYDKNIAYYINLGMITFVIITAAIIIYNKLKSDKLEKDYNTMLEYVSKYEKIINEQGKKNHEYNNQLMVLNGYINNKEKLKEYLSNIIKEQKGGKNYTIEQLSYFPDGGIKGLIYHKLSKMDEYKVRPYLYIDKETKDIFETSFDINTYRDITKLFGVFLDNAIEAASKAEKREVEIDMHKKDDYLIVIIGNTFDKSIEVDKIGKTGFTTKGTGHGFGLSIVKDISKNNSKIETFNNIDGDLFKQTIMIDLK